MFSIPSTYEFSASAAKSAVQPRLHRGTAKTHLAWLKNMLERSGPILTCSSHRILAMMALYESLHLAASRLARCWKELQCSDQSHQSWRPQPPFTNNKHTALRSHATALRSHATALRSHASPTHFFALRSHASPTHFFSQSSYTCM